MNYKAGLLPLEEMRDTALLASIDSFVFNEKSRMIGVFKFNEFHRLLCIGDVYVAFRTSMIARVNMVISFDVLSYVDIILLSSI